MSSDRENEYFVDGLTEEILNRLAQISALRVPGRTSSFAFKGKNTDLRQIGTELGVAHVLEGSVRKSGDRLRITSQLIRTADGFHLWSQTFDRKLDDVFAIQDEIARAIADALSTPLGLSEPVNPQRQTKDMEAYDKFLQARAYLAQRTPENLRRAMELLTVAVDRDPGFANGWAALAQARALSSYYLNDIPDPLRAAEEAARKALALDDTIAMAHSALADVLRDRRDWLAAEGEYARALKLSPAEAETHNQYAQMLLKLGRIDGALQHGLRACELEPLGWVPPTVVSLAYLSRGDLVQSRAFLDRSEKLSDRLRGFQSRMELMYALSRGDPDLARRALKLAQQATWSPGPPTPELIAALDQALAGFQNSSAAPLDLGKTLKEFGPSGPMPLSAVAAFVGQKEVAIDAIFLEAETSIIDIPGLIWTPVYRPLRSEPRFLELLRRMKMPEYWRVAGWSEFCRPKGDNDFECIEK
jgi:TolB-like protein/Tfp pilus assembly protein PilF